MNKNKIICKKRKYSRGSIFQDSPKKPGAKDGQIGLSKSHNIRSPFFCTKNFFKIHWIFKKNDPPNWVILSLVEKN